MLPIGVSARFTTGRRWTMDAKVKEWLEFAREADVWAGMMADPTLRAEWIEFAEGYRAMARNRLETLLNPPVPQPAVVQLPGD